LFINPRNPWNGYIENFDDKLMDECLTVISVMVSRQAIVEAFRHEYNNYRPHSLLYYLTPVEFARRYHEKNQLTVVKLKDRKSVVVVGTNNSGTPGAP